MNFLEKAYRNRHINFVEQVKEEKVLEKNQRKDGQKNKVGILIVPYEETSVNLTREKLVDYGYHWTDIHIPETFVDEDNLSEVLNEGMDYFRSQERYDAVLVLPSTIKAFDRQILEAAELVNDKHTYLLVGIEGFGDFETLRHTIRYGQERDGENWGRHLKDFYSGHIKWNLSQRFSKESENYGVRGAIIPLAQDVSFEGASGDLLGVRSARRLSALMDYKPTISLK